MSNQRAMSEFTSSILSNLKTMMDVNAIIGDPITTPGGTVIIPVSKISFGYANGGSDIPASRPEGFTGGSGAGVTIQPIAFLVINGDKVELTQMQTADNTSDRIVNAIPGVIDKIVDLFPKKNKDKDKLDSQNKDENKVSAD